jgi:hypothetical protein
MERERNDMKTFSLLIPLVLATVLAAQQGTIVNYGSGCNGSILSFSEPKIGTTLNFTVLNNDATCGVLGLGVSRFQFFVGTTNGESCYLNIFPVIGSVPFTSLGGSGGGVVFPIPNNTALIGCQFVAQSVSADSNGTGWSQGAEITIGN